MSGLNESLLDSNHVEIVGVQEQGRAHAPDDAEELLHMAAVPPLVRNESMESRKSIKQSVSGVYGRLERLDVDPINQPYYVDAHRKLERGYNPNGQIVFTSKVFYRWILTVLIGMAIAIVARGVQVAIQVLVDQRNDQVEMYVKQGSSMFQSFVFFAVWNSCFALVGGLLTITLEPATAADGIAEIKAFMNGTHVKRFLKLRTILVKIVGTILAACSGLASGSEGPLIHIGAGIASGVTRGDKVQSLCFEFSPAILGRFHNDRDRRHFISAGAGAGMAAAFGAPIGGVLFVLEETSNAWTPQLIWHMFTAALVATVSLAFIKADLNSGDVSLAGLLSFGTTNTVQRLRDGGILADSSVEAPIYWWEIIMFVVVGIFGGIVGGVFNRAVSLLSLVRPRNNLLRALEVFSISLITSASIFYLVVLNPVCRDNGLWTCKEAGNWGDWCSGPLDLDTCKGPTSSCANASAWICHGGSSSGRSCRDSDCEQLGGKCLPLQIPSINRGMQMGCDVGQYNELATLLFGHHELSISRMMTQAWPFSPYSIASMLKAAAVTFVLMLVTFGAHIPTGIFMPCVFIGSCLGRVVGEYVKLYVDPRVFAGIYALAGASAVLGGVQRGTISLVIIMIEGTGNVHSLLPVVVSTCVANLVGNFFGKEGLYDVLIKRKKLRFLPHVPDSFMSLCFVGDVMSRPVVSFKVIEKIGDIVDVLRSCSHNGFPVVSVEDEKDPSSTPAGRMEGTILRSTLRTLLSARFQRDAAKAQSMWQRITSERKEDLNLNGDKEMYIQMETSRLTGTKISHSVKDWEWALFTGSDRDRYINLGPYMNAAPYTVHETCLLNKAFDLFQQMSLRHLPVLDVCNRPVGIITRDNLTNKLLHKTISSYFRPEEVYLQPDEVRTPRLHGAQQVQRQRQRIVIQSTIDEDSDMKESMTTGGSISSWQSRLAAALGMSC
mmetsp:Transcript_49459/g.155052  ORF Transcript_49459/g.155052 Transcript_49459/m.155052 type:complete len:946 (-) Transcript_49459:44-2881(-)